MGKGKIIRGEEFIERARKIHGNKYDYSKTKYINNTTKVCIICPEHGEFWQIPASHLKGCGCRKCGFANMGKKHNLTNDGFIEKAKNLFGNQYDYSLVKYVKSFEKVKIKCNKCGSVFLVTPNSHLKGQGCPECARNKKGRRKKTTKEFIKEAENLHGNKYDYSKTNYLGNNKKVCIICPEHGEFWQTPAMHLSGQGCPKCGLASRVSKRTNNTETFIEKARKIHGDKYDYSKVEYKNARTKVCIICPEHGEFWQTPAVHLRGGDHPKKASKKAQDKRDRVTTSEFIEKAKLVHGDKYDYSKLEYINNKTKVCIICPIHGEFWQIPDGHLHGQGCPYCRESKLEKNVENILIKNNISFIKQCRKSTLNWLGRLSLDFYLPEYKLAIECQGKQHFIPVQHFGGENGFSKIIERDKEKLKKCNENGVRLIYYTNEPKKAPYVTLTDEMTLMNEIIGKQTAPEVGADTLAVDTTVVDTTVIDTVNVDTVVAE